MAFGKRTVLGLAVITAGAFAALNPGVVKAFYEDIYPSDPTKSEALDMCFMENHTFNRLDSGERDACYKRMLRPLGEITAAAQASFNPVDLQRAAAQPNMPHNDIIRLQENRTAPH
jgi:hypothetical protein